ncbi:hypothetical protein TNCV_3606301 [Trichonephila clavipes]|nr:hypothetical protein TNCV_3606301 [Trichonephila clavipes]
MDDFLANEARTLEPLTSSMVVDANSITKTKVVLNPKKKVSLPEFNYNRELTSTMTTLRMEYFKDTDILPDGSRSCEI